MTDRVGVRELRQDLSRFLRRVRAGERLTVTEHGRPVAVLAPWLDEADPLSGLVAEGRLRRGAGELAALQPLDRPISSDASAALADDRDDE